MFFTNQHSNQTVFDKRQIGENLLGDINKHIVKNALEPLVSTKTHDQDSSKKERQGIISNFFTHTPAQNKHGTGSQLILDYFNRMEIPPILPPQVQLDLSNLCNLKCAYCSFPAKQKTQLQLDSVIEFLQFYEKHGGKSVFLTGGGEPGTYKYLEQFLEFFTQSNLILTLNTNGYFIKKIKRIAKQNPRLLQSIWHSRKPTATISFSLHNDEVFTRVADLHKLRSELGLNLSIRTSFLISESMTVEEADTLIIKSQNNGADIVCPKPMHTRNQDSMDIEDLVIRKNSQYYKRVFQTNPRLYNYLNNYDCSHSKIQVKPTRLDRITQNFNAQLEASPITPICLSPLLYVVVNALQENAICCDLKLPSLAENNYYAPAGKALQSNVFSYYVDLLWNIVTYDDSYCILGCNMMEVNSEYDQLNPDFIQLLIALRAKHQSETISKPQMLEIILNKFSTKHIQAAEIEQKQAAETMPESACVNKL